MQNNQPNTNKSETSQRRSAAIARRRTKKIVALSVLALFMALSIGLTFTFWQAGIIGSSNNRGDHPGINIGTAHPVDTEVVLSAFTSNQGDALIPQAVFAFGNPVEIEDATDNVTLRIPVLWQPDPMEATPNLLSGVTSTLRVTAAPTVRIYNDAGTEIGTIENTPTSAWSNRDTSTMVDADRYTGDASLFEFFFSTVATTESTFAGATGTTIAGNTSLPIYITVRMNIPRDRTDFNLLTNNEVRFTFTFTVDNVLLP